MTITTERSMIETVAQRWRQHYFPFKGALSSGKSSKQIHEELLTLDPATATPADVETIIGNGSWCRLRCDECEKDVNWLITVGEAPDYESATASLCRDCLTKAYGMLTPTPAQTPS